MDERAKLTEEAQRGESARQLMENPLFVEAVQTVESRIVEAMRNCDTQSRDQHQTLILSLQLLGQITKHIRTVADTGRMAEIQLRKPMRERIRAAFR